MAKYTCLGDRISPPDIGKNTSGTQKATEKSGIYPVNIAEALIDP